MTHEHKQQIAALVETQCTKTSQVRWANANKVSGATVNWVVNRKWENISDKMWHKLAAAVGFHAVDWRLAETTNFKRIQGWCAVAKDQSLSLALSAPAGSGKTACLRRFAETNGDVFYIQCAEHWNKKLFISNLYRAMGKAPGEMTIAELAEAIIYSLRQQQRPLIILDEVDKLRDPLVMFFIELYNRLDGICGFFLVGAPYLAKAWEKNALRDKRGFQEVYSRIGRKFLELKRTQRKDVKLICEANGVTDEDTINMVWNGVELDPDLRRVKRELDKMRLEKAA